MSAFVFKVQANMDPNHRDRIAFVRLCSGKLTRGMKVKQVRTGKALSLHDPKFFFAQDRELADEALAGDVVGIPNHGVLRIGDTLTEGENLNFVGVPNFAPEILRRVRLPDAMKAKQLKQALQELAEEGVVQVFRPLDGSPALVGVVGALQLDVLRVRLADEYGLEVNWDTAEFQLARWIAADDRKTFDRFVAAYRSAIAEDLDGDLVFLARNAFNLDYTGRRARHRLHRREGHPGPRQTGGVSNRWSDHAWSSLPGLTRQSIPLREVFLRTAMDPRVKPAGDAGECATAGSKRPQMLYRPSCPQLRRPSFSCVLSHSDNGRALPEPFFAAVPFAAGRLPFAAGAPLPPPP